MISSFAQSVTWRPIPGHNKFAAMHAISIVEVSLVLITRGLLMQRKVTSFLSTQGLLRMRWMFFWESGNPNFKSVSWQIGHLTTTIRKQRIPPRFIYTWPCSSLTMLMASLIHILFGLRIGYVKFEVMHCSPQYGKRLSRCRGGRSPSCLFLLPKLWWGIQTLRRTKGPSFRTSKDVESPAWRCQNRLIRTSKRQHASGMSCNLIRAKNTSRLSGSEN